MKKFWIIFLSIVFIVLIVYLINRFLFTKKVSPSISYGNTITNPTKTSIVNPTKTAIVYTPTFIS